MIALKIFLNRLRVLSRALRGDYRFSVIDYWLYLCYAEYPGLTRHFPIIQIAAKDDDYVQLQICDYRYYWPSEASWSGLEWMHQEVFVPAYQNAHAYEFAGVKIKPGDFVIDAGACEGFFTRFALQRNATVLALEPVFRLTEALGHTFGAEIANGQVEVLCVALGAKAEQARLYTEQSNLYESRIGEVGSEIWIKTLDDISGEKRIDFIKMDIEGSEMDAIIGARQTIAKHKPRLAIAVYHGLENANYISHLLREIRSDYKINFRGIYAWDGCVPRPFMVLAW